MILLQVYLHTYCLLRGVTFKILPFSNYARIQMMMMPLFGTFLELLSCPLWTFMLLKNTWLFFIASPSWALEIIEQLSFAFFPNFTQRNLILIHCPKNQSLIFVTRSRNSRFISATTSARLALMHWNHNWCKLKHVQICLYYSQVVWLLLSQPVKSIQELHSHTMYVMVWCLVKHRLHLYGMVLS